jgi:hypothetical protein
MFARTVIRVVAAVALLACSTAQAQLFRAYLSAAGSDGNPCTLTSPCRLLPAALNAVASGGEIWMLDSANYNSATVNINKSVSILAVPGVVGSIVAQNGGPAVSITASGLNVALRNLVIGPVVSAAPGTDGVVLTGASTLTIEDSLIANVPEFGIRVAGSGVLKVANTTLRSNGKFAILLTAGGSATVSSTQMLANGWGGFSAQLSTAATSTSSISDSVISGGANGVYLRSNAGMTTRLALTRSTIERTDYALISQASDSGVVSIALSGSMIVNNNYGWYVEGSGAIIRSLGNNHFSDNTTSLGSLTPVPAQ